MGASGFSEFNFAPASTEKLDAKPVLQVLNGMADGAGRDVEFFRGDFEAPGPRGNFEHTDSAQRRQLDWHLPNPRFCRTDARLAQGE